MIGHCDSCGFNDVDVEEHGNVSAEKLRRDRYCEVCASTFISRAERGDSVGSVPSFQDTRHRIQSYSSGDSEVEGRAMKIFADLYNSRNR